MYFLRFWEANWSQIKVFTESGSGVFSGSGFVGAVLSLHRADIYASFRNFSVGFLRKRGDVCELVILARYGHRSSHSHMMISDGPLMAL